MKKHKLIMGLIAGTVLLGTVALADKEPLQPQTQCPVMKGKIDKAFFVEYEGKRIYVCCKECIAPVKKDPAKCIRKLEAGGVKLEKTQTTCTVMGGKIDKKAYTDYNGKRVYFCCAGCPTEFKKDPAKYISKLKKEGVTLEKAPAKDPTKKQQAAKPEAAPSKWQDDSGKKGCGGCM